MKHGSLFSGIGGFDVAAQWMGWENKFHCEWNEFGQKVLHHYWPEAELFTDITKSDFTKYHGTIDIISGGFPCQPYSSAGKRLGKEDDRHLWPEMLRVIREVRPRWVVGENVLGLVNWNGGLAFHEVQTDLEAEGYEVQPYVLPAAAVAHHIEGTEFGLLPTPMALTIEENLNGWEMRMEKRVQIGKNVVSPNLHILGMKGLLPTPTCMDATNATANMKSSQVKEGSMHSVTLNRAMTMGMLPTPMAAEGGKLSGNEKENQMSMTKLVKQEHGATSQLNPQFVAEMMGFPTNWTELPFQSGETNP
jgi:hypothetical protein